MVYPRGIWPVRFDCNKAKTLLDDEIAGDAFAHLVEFGGTVGRFAKQYDA